MNRTVRTGVLLAIAVVTAWLVAIVPPPGIVLGRTFSHSAEIGQTIHLRSADVTIVSVTTATAIATSTRVLPTTGAFLVVTLRFTPTTEPWKPQQLRIRDAKGRDFGGPQPVAIDCPGAQPGLTMICESYNEIPSDALDGRLRIEVPSGPYDGDDALLLVIDPPASSGVFISHKGHYLRKDEP